MNVNSNTAPQQYFTLKSIFVYIDVCIIHTYHSMAITG